MYSDLIADTERELAVYRDASIGTFGSTLVDHSRTTGTIGIRQGGSGHNSPIMNTPEAGQFSIHQHMSTVSGSSNINNGNANARIADNIPNSSPSPSYSHIQSSSSFNEQEGQSAADHIILYTIIRELCSIRMMLTGIYRLISLSTVEIDVDDIIPDIEHAQRYYESEAPEIQSSVLGAGIECEIRSLKHGLLLHKAISEYDIQKSSINLHLARVALSEWHHISSEQDYADKSYNRPEETSWRYNFFSSGEDKSKSSLAAKGKFNLQPNHLLWLNRWITSEKSKMTIYFMETLLEKEKAMGGDERSLWVNTEPDLHGMIRTFRKKAGAHSISFVFEISQGLRFSRLGFVSANAPYEAPTGNVGYHTPILTLE
ncbi:hypothetical protein BGX21_011377 [Mortierella sp. AD011]|nr:hypothetical protein BGX21_011377 [Mortierella sp. AD011]